MDFLSRAYAQGSELFKSMTLGARITSGLLLAVIVISLAYLIQGQVDGPDTYLFGAQAFSSAEITSMEAAFSKAGLGGYLVEGSKVRIPRGEQAAYVAALAEGNALPTNFSSLMEDLVSGGSPFESEKQRQQRVNTSKQRLLSLAIKSMTGIEDALVLFDVQEGTGLARKKEVTASVSVRCSSNQPMEDEQVPAIRHLVVGAIAGLTPDKVSVTCMNSGHTFAGGTSSRAGGGTLDDYSERKRFLEKEYTEKIRSVLHFVRGVSVATDVTLDTEVDHKEVSTTVDPKPVTVDLHSTETTSSTQAAAPAGRPGVAAQGGMNQAGAVSTTSTGSRSDDESREERQRSLVGTKQIETRKHGLTPERVTAAIGVPSSHYENIWRQRNPTPPGEEPPAPDPKALATIEADEIKNIRDMVAQIIPLPPGIVPDVTPLVTVKTFQHIDPPAMATPSLAETAIASLGQYWSSIGLGLLGLISLFMLRSMIRSIPVAEPPAPMAIPFPTEDEKDDEVEAAAKRRRRANGEPDPREDLMDIVREDPDAAANILRNWISNAG